LEGKRKKTAKTKKVPPKYRSTNRKKGGDKTKTPNRGKTQGPFSRKKNGFSAGGRKKKRKMKKARGIVTTSKKKQRKKEKKDKE